MPTVLRKFWPMALHSLHGPCLFQLPLLALGMTSTTNTPPYPTPPASQPEAIPRPPKFFPPDRYAANEDTYSCVRRAHLGPIRYVAAQAQFVFYGIVSRLPMVAWVSPCLVLSQEVSSRADAIHAAALH